MCRLGAIREPVRRRSKIVPWTTAGSPTKSSCSASDSASGWLSRLSTDLMRGLGYSSRVALMNGIMRIQFEGPRPRIVCMGNRSSSW